MLGWLLLISSVLAQDAVKLEVVHTVHAGRSPALLVFPQIDADELQVRVNCAGDEQVYDSPTQAGAEIRLDFTVAVGTHTCTGKLNGTFADGTSGEMPLSFQVTVQPGIKMNVSAADLDLAHNSIRVHPNQALSELSIQVYGIDGRLGGGTLPIEPPSANPTIIQWQQEQGEVVRIQVLGTGPSGLSTTLNLFPWRYKVPHEEVVFATNQSDIRRSEVPKLKDALAQINAVFDRFAGGHMGFDVPLRVYIAGYTDTVGSAASNKKLSESRAQSIGKWFRDNGISKPIFVQGFGERSLAVLTGDEVDESRNRRAVYIVSAQEPPRSDLLPATDWQPLKAD